jgi:hypothetical protein
MGHLPNRLAVASRHPRCSLSPYEGDREITKPNGVYKSWHPLDQHYAEMAAFFSDVAKVIGRSGIHGIGGIARLVDLDKFNRETGLRLQPYPVAVYGTLIALWNLHEREPVDLFFDRVESVSSKLTVARSYADTDGYYAGDLDGKILSPVAEGSSFRDLVGIASRRLPGMGMA